MLRTKRTTTNAKTNYGHPSGGGLFYQNQNYFWAKKVGENSPL